MWLPATRFLFEMSTSVFCQLFYQGIFCLFYSSSLKILDTKPLPVLCEAYFFFFWSVLMRNFNKDEYINLFLNE